MVGVDAERPHGQHRSHASIRECSRETVGANVELCDLPEPALGKHSREVVLCNREGGHGQHRSHASVGECSREAVLVNVEPCDLPEPVHTVDI
eukprot:6184935-Amphidinium_carterae.1